MIVLRGNSLREAVERGGLLLLRLVTSLIFLYHGYPKAMDWTMASSQFAELGFPGFLGPFVGIVEVVFGVALLVGFLSRFSAFTLAIVITVALATVQIPGTVAEWTLLTSGLERDLLLLAGLIVILGAGPGSLAVDGQER